MVGNQSAAWIKPEYRSPTAGAGNPAQYKKPSPRVPFNARRQVGEEALSRQRVCPECCYVSN